VETQTRIGIGASAMLALIFYFAPNLGWLWAIPALFICAVVAAWGLWPAVKAGVPSKDAVIRFWGESGKRQFYSIGLVLMGILIGSIISYRDSISLSVTKGTGPIIWNFEEAASGHGYFLNLQKTSNGGEVMVSSFGAHGKNNSSEPINDFEGFIRSDLTNETAPLYLIALESSATNVCSPSAPTLPKDTSGIPPFADFDIVSSKKPFYVNIISEGAQPVSNFMSRSVPFTVVVRYSGKTYQRQFSKAEVDKQVALLEKLAGPITIPHVVRKESAPPVPLPPLATPRPPATTSPDITGKIPKQ
jgi:hypothetical protein